MSGSARKIVSNSPEFTCTDVEVDVYSPSNHTTTPDETITYEDVESVEFETRLTDWKDEGTIIIHNIENEYSDTVVSGTRLDVTIELGRAFPWGDPDSVWGQGAWGGRELAWTAMVRDREFVHDAPRRGRLVLACEDFVAGVLSKRQVFDSWTNEQIAGTDDSIVDEVIQNEASEEVDRDRIETITQTTTAHAAGKNALDLLGDIARRAGANFYSERTSIVFEVTENKSPIYTLSAEDFGPASIRETDTDLVNRIRVDGGSDSRVDDEQLTADDYATIDEDNRKMFRVDTRKSMIEKLEVWTKTVGGSGDSVRVRVQKDNGAGTAPIAPNDDTSDLVDRTLAAEFLDDDGFTTFEFREHILPEPGPWVIVETDGDDTQQLGIQSSSGTPAFRSYYKYQVTIQQTDAESQRKYGLREDRESAPNASIEEAREIAESILTHRDAPVKEFHAPAQSLAARSLRIGDAVTLDMPMQNAEGKYIVSERTVLVENGQADVSLGMYDVDTI